MRVVLLANPYSGRARNARRLRRLVSRLRDERIDLATVSPGQDHLLSASLAAADALVVAGGDGSVHHALGPAAAAGVPLYHYPVGTENLFARESGASTSLDQLVESLRNRRTALIDMATCNGRPFMLMLSIGFDAQVVQRVARARALRPLRGVARIDYLRHALAELRHLRTPRLRVASGSRTLVNNETGFLLVANSPRYAAGLDPCRSARWDDGRLDALFLPYSSRTGLLKWIAAIVTRTHDDLGGARFAAVGELTISCDQPDVPIQLDGESVPGTGRLHLAIEVAKARFPMLVPARPPRP